MEAASLSFVQHFLVQWSATWCSRSHNHESLGFSLPNLNQFAALVQQITWITSYYFWILFIIYSLNIIQYHHLYFPFQIPTVMVFLASELVSYHMIVSRAGPPGCCQKRIFVHGAMGTSWQPRTRQTCGLSPIRFAWQPMPHSDSVNSRIRQIWKSTHILDVHVRTHPVSQLPWHFCVSKQMNIWLTSVSNRINLTGCAST